MTDIGVFDTFRLSGNKERNTQTPQGLLGLQRSSSVPGNEEGIASLAYTLTSSSFAMTMINLTFH